MKVIDLYNFYLEETNTLDNLVKVQDDFMSGKINPQDIKLFAEHLKLDFLRSKKILHNITIEIYDILGNNLYELTEKYENGKFLHICNNYGEYEIEILKKYKGE